MSRIVVFNVSSASLKWSLLDVTTEALAAGGEEPYAEAAGSNVGNLVRQVLTAAGAVEAVGYRVVHGGSVFREAVRVDQQMIDMLITLNELAPLHNPVTIMCMKAALETAPEALHVAAFDTAFHRTLPEKAATYAIPREWTERYAVRKFGFHGLSVAYAVRRVAELLHGTPHRHIVCHLGVGCSVTAVRDGQSVDTSMGFTPLEGVMMATRTGTLDPGLVLYLVRNGIDVESCYDAFEHRSGLLGVSNVSSDIRAIMEEATRGDSQARLAYDMFIHSAVRVVGGMVAALGGLDVLTFTGGVGEHQAPIRQQVASALAYLGVALDPVVNGQTAGDRDISSADSSVRAFVIQSREDLSVLREVKAFIERRQAG
jgi:acetate kinase